jgi:hypothetical protein
LSFDTVSELTLETNFVKSLLSREILLDILGSDPTISPHHASHELGGLDQIKLDDLGVPDDNTDLDATTSRHGLMEKLDNDVTHFLSGIGTWVTPPTIAHASTHLSGQSDVIKLDDLAAPDVNTDLDVTTVKHGLMKQLDGDITHFFSGTGTWIAPSSFPTFLDMAVITIPANPVAGYVRFYPKVIDANNDGIFCLIKKGNVFVEEQLI